MNAISDRSKILLTSTVIMMATTLVVGNIMAQNVWNGSVSGDWGNAANWDVSSKALVPENRLSSMLPVPLILKHTSELPPEQSEV